MQDELEKVVADYRELEEGLAAAETEKEALERDRAGCSKDIKELETQKAELEKLLKDLAKHKASVKKQKDKLEKEVENCGQEIAKMEKVPILVICALESCTCRSMRRAWSSCIERKNWCGVCRTDRP